MKAELITVVAAVVRHQLQMEANQLASKSEVFQVKDELRLRLKTTPLLALSAAEQETMLFGRVKEGWEMS